MVEALMNELSGPDGRSHARVAQSRDYYGPNEGGGLIRVSGPFARQQVVGDLDVGPSPSSNDSGVL